MQTYTAPEFIENLSEIEKSVQEGNFVYLTNKGKSMVVLSAKIFEELTAEIENKLDEADILAERNSARLNHDEVFSSLRRSVNV